MTKVCVICGKEIPEGRQKALPNAKTCVDCCTTSKYIGNVVSMGEKNNESEIFSEVEIIKDAQIIEKVKKASVKIKKNEQDV